MQFFEYPYVIITILAMLILVMGLFGLYFVIKSERTAKGTSAKSFISLGKIESEFEKAARSQINRSIIFIFVSLDSIQTLYPESRVERLYEQIKGILLNHLSININGEISLYGEENFVAINNLKSDILEQCIDNCYKALNEVFTDNGAANLARIRFGYTSTAATDLTFKNALARAKQACGMAEDKGELYCQWDSTNGKKFEKKIELENSIDDEIENDNFFLEFQPIIDVKTQKIIGAEVLSRLNSPNHGIVAPSDFLPAIDSQNLNGKFDLYVFEKACKWISSDKEKRSKYLYTINFSRQTLCDINLVDNILDTIEEYGIDSSCIAVEILEDKTLENDEKSVMINNLIHLKEKGVLFLLDDFGTGHTWFGDLTDFDISILKIDRTIINSAKDKPGYSVLENIVNLAHDLGFKALCEGVEDEEQQLLAIKAGCDMLQGFYFYRPMLVSRFEALFDKE